MQAPIPDDWINEAWLCYAIQWPDSTKWLSILNGLLSNPRQGRFWNARSGSIVNVQETGAEIWHRNNPLVSCADSAECPTVVYIDRIVYRGCESSHEEEVEDMACNGPIPFEAREDGLYYYYCCEWVKVWPGAGSAANGQPGIDLGDTPLEPEGADPPTYNACGKAYAAADLIFEVAHAAWYVGNNENFWEWPGEFRSRFPELSGGDVTWNDACFWAFSADAISEETYVIPDLLKAEIRCKLALRLDADAAGTTDEDYAYIFGLIQDWFNWDEGPEATVALRFWVAAYATIGKGDLRNLSMLGATTVADCDCPDEAEVSPLFSGYALGADWRYVFDFRNTLPDYAELGSGVLQTLGQGLWSDCGATQNNNEVSIKLHLDQINNGSVATNIGILYRTRGDEDYNNSSGSSVKIEDTEHISVTDMEAATGTTPAQAGVNTITKVINDPMGAAEDVFDIGIAVYHAGDQLPDVIESSIVILAFFVAGTGPGPLSDPPA